MDIEKNKIINYLENMLQLLHESDNIKQMDSIMYSKGIITVLKEFAFEDNWKAFLMLIIKEDFKLADLEKGFRKAQSKNLSEIWEEFSHSLLFILQQFEDII